MAHAMQANQFLKIPADKLRTVIADDSWMALRIELMCALKHKQDIMRGHFFTNVPMHNEPAVTIQNADQVVERKPTFPSALI
ncbi:MAG: hypothetical protein D6820_10610 [Lentisphaerae bacterium]|nr:MAG: hypothetical protein D6820_10610 [Lentisphaerota bacterium]